MLEFLKFYTVMESSYRIVRIHSFNVKKWHLKNVNLLKRTANKINYVSSQQINFIFSYSLVYLLAFCLVNNFILFYAFCQNWMENQSYINMVAHNMYMYNEKVRNLIRWIYYNKIRI